MGKRKTSKTASSPDQAKLDEILVMRHDGKSWRFIAGKLGQEVNPGTVWKWAKTGAPPKDAKVRRKLSLPIYHAVEECPHCGVLPVQKRHRCAAAAPRPRKAPPLVRLVAGLLASGHLQVSG